MEAAEALHLKTEDDYCKRNATASDRCTVNGKRVAYEVGYNVKGDVVHIITDKPEWYCEIPGKATLVAGATVTVGYWLDGVHRNLGEYVVSYGYNRAGNNKEDGSLVLRTLSLVEAKCKEYGYIGGMLP
jgi:hypothetical protein